MVGFSIGPRDGRLVAYVSAEGGTLHIWRMDADGANKKQLTTARAKVIRALP